MASEAGSEKASVFLLGHWITRPGSPEQPGKQADPPRRGCHGVRKCGQHKEATEGKSQPTAGIHPEVYVWTHPQVDLSPQQTFPAD